VHWTASRPSRYPATRPCVDIDRAEPCLFRANHPKLTTLFLRMYDLDRLEYLLVTFLIWCTRATRSPISGQGYARMISFRSTSDTDAD
jgi:hypothetical protein